MNPYARVDDENEANRNRFKGGQYRDVWWLVFFVVHLFVFVGIGVYYFVSLFPVIIADSNTESSSTSNSSLQISVSSPKVWVLLALLMLLASLAAALWIFIAKRYPQPLLKFSLISMLVLAIFLFGLFLFLQIWVGALLQFILVLLYIWYMYVVWDKLSFAALCLETALTSVSIYSNVYFVVAFAIFLQCAWIVIFMVSLIGIIYALTEGSPTKGVSSAAFFFVYFACLISFFWTANVIKNVVHMTICGVTATWYFLYPNNVHVNASPVTQSLRRATTWSLGSICLGSLIVAIISALYATCRAIESSMSRDNICGFIFLCIIEAFLSWLQSIAEFVNRFAFSYCAIYGESFCDAASSVWDLLKSKGFMAVLTDSVIGALIFIGALLGGLACLFVALGVSALAFKVNNMTIAVWCIIGFLIGLFIILSVLEVIEAAVTTIFVCLANDPDALYVSKPDVYRKFVDPLTREHNIIITGRRGPERA